MIVEAGPGHDGYYNNTNCGGDGYSGGGGGCCHPFGYPGGSDGSDGGDFSSNTGGKGSGLDLGALNMTRFVLTPGKGGTHYSGSFGGGGGGILVNGEEPSGGRGYQAEGFGGGGSRGYYGNGRPGCVLIEV